MFASSVSGGDFDVLRYAIGTPPGGPFAVVAGGVGDEDQPDVYGNTVAYRGTRGDGKRGVYVRNWNLPYADRTPGGSSCPEAPEGEPSIAELVAAWECGTPGSRSVAVLAGAGEYRLAPPTPIEGEQFGPATFRSLVAFVDGGDGGSVWLHDSANGTSARVCSGPATGVGVGEFRGKTMVAVTRPKEGAVPDPEDPADVEVWSVRWDATELVTALRVPGEQRNPHLSADWVAFEDLSTDRSQVVLWHWTDRVVFLPSPGTSNQTLNDLATIPGAEVDAVFADDANGVDRDVALYRLVLDTNGKVPDDGAPNPLPWDPPARPLPASCDGPGDGSASAPVVLATLDIERVRGHPSAGSAAFDAEPFPGDEVLPVLVCVDAERVSAGWVTLDGEVVASPGDFTPPRTRLAIPAVAEGGAGTIAAVIGGKPGSAVSIRVLADPGRAPPGCDGDDGAASADVLGLDGDPGFGNAGYRWIAAEQFDRRSCDVRPPPAGEQGTRNGFGCTTAGGGGALALLALLVAAHPKRRR